MIHDYTLGADVDLVILTEILRLLLRVAHAVLVLIDLNLLRFFGLVVLLFNFLH